MFTFNKPEQFYRLGKALFLAFAFFSAIICGQIRVNNLFHLAALLYLAWLVTLLDGERRHQLQWVMLAGIAALCLYLTLVNAPSIYHLRETTPCNPGPSNVIDLAGYAAIAILLSLMIFRDPGRRRRPPLLTQSRGPLMALVFMLVATMPYRQTDSGRESGCGSCCPAR